MIITTDGIVVTSHHVVDSRDYAYSVETTDGSVYMVEVLYQDSINDISYLRMLTEKSDKKIFEIVPIAHENRLKKNDIILSFDASGDVGKRATTFGQVKSLGETIKIDDDSEKVLKNLIKSDIRLEPGSSGGPIIDMSGDIVGINTAYINQGEKQGWHTPLTQEKIQKFLDHIDQ